MSVPIGHTQYAIIGMNPTTGTFYVFNSGALVMPGPGANPNDIPATIGNIAVEPSNPLHSLVVGPFVTAAPSILELDDCGNVVSQTPPWGQLRLPPGIPLDAFPVESLAFSPVTGRVWLPTDLIDPDNSGHLLLSLPSTGGVATDSFVTSRPFPSPAGPDGGPAAMDELGNLYISGMNIVNGFNVGSAILKFTADTLTSPNPIGVTLPAVPGLSPFNALVGDGNGSLLVAHFDSSSGNGFLSKVDTTTGAASLFSGNLDPIASIAADAQGDLWVSQFAGTNSAFPVLQKISGTTGAVLQSIPFPAQVGGLDLTHTLTAGMAVLGVNLPAVRKGCAPTPIVSRAIEATATTANLNPPARIDSFLSCRGAYGGNNVSAHGDVQAGTSIIVNAGAQINGAQLPNSPVAPVSIALPSTLTTGGTLAVNAGLTLAAGDYLFDNIYINSGGSLIGSGGLVRIWYRGNLIVNGIVTAAGNLPGNLWLLGLPGSSPVYLNSSAQVSGVIDSPTSVTSSGATLVGAAIGSTVTVNGGQVHYDQVLGGATCP